MWKPRTMHPSCSASIGQVALDISSNLINNRALLQAVRVSRTLSVALLELWIEDEPVLQLNGPQALCVRTHADGPITGCWARESVPLQPRRDTLRPKGNAVHHWVRSGATACDRQIRYRITS